MSQTNTARSYGTVTKTLHWLTALLILTVLPLGLIASNLADSLQQGGSVPEARIALTGTLFSLHKTLGLTLFAVALVRILWALTQVRPGLLNADHKAEAFLAETIHFVLYGALVLTPLTGWITHAATTGFAPIWWPFGQSLPFVPKSQDVAHLFAGLHVAFQWTLLAALALHIAGALKHHVIDRDATLRRMWFARADLPVPPTAAHTRRPALAAAALWAAVLGYGVVTGVPQHDAPQTTAAEQTTNTSVENAWTVTDGTLDIAITQFGNSVTGRFANWQADIRFDPDAAPGTQAGDVTVTVAIPSLTLGSVTEQAMGPDFFDAGTYARAIFEGQIEHTDTGYVATGPLTLKGQSADIRLPFTLTQADGTADGLRMTGDLELNRLDYGIGAQMPEGDTLALDVRVSVDLTATPATRDQILPGADTPPSQ
ncbi:cytochrome b/b6 domain-containing protein [Chachezhania antarctica]|uniref:cytochrome b/b6 domain-containing protein n=1 Tax=Chachezhania antarctica TaxID=2340860 RepID=UPI000EAC6B3D|nr:cytochrome b/b6 domain-containing protein [Chachezhania antarctica]